MGELIPILVVAVILAFAGGVLCAGALNKVVHARQDCPLCWESIPTGIEYCPKCNCKL